MTGEVRRRADAERNIEAILDAALDCISDQPDVNMTAIAKAAGVSRVTLYAHFASKEDLVARVLDRAVLTAAEVFDTEALDEGAPAEALARLVRSGWRVLVGYRNLMTAANEVLSPARVRGFHNVVLRRVEKLIVRGRREGAFRTDVPQAWLVTVFYSLLHSAAEEVAAGRLRQRDAAGVLVATLVSALAPPSR